MPAKDIFLAIEKAIYDGIFSELIGDVVLKNFNVHLLVFDETKEATIQWID